MLVVTGVGAAAAFAFTLSGSPALLPHSAFSAKCVDKYCALRVQQYERSSDANVVIDPRLEEVVNRMFARCYDNAQYKQALGIALEARRLDVVRHALTASSDLPAALEYALTICRNLVQHQGFRNEVRLASNTVHILTTCVADRPAASDNVISVR